MEKPVKEAQKRYKEISDIVEGDDRGEKFLNNLLSSVDRYVSNASNLQAYLKSNGRDSRLEGCCYETHKHQERVNELENLRKTSHENLISRLHMFNRYLFNQYPEETPSGGIYTLSRNSIKDRNAIGDWAGYLYKAISTLNKPLEQQNDQ